MPDLFGLDIAGLVHDNLSSGLPAAKLTKTIPGERTAANLAGGTNATESSVTGRGILVKYDEKVIDGTIIQRGDRQILLIAKSLQGKVPNVGDTVEIESTKWTVLAADRDPAGATYTCHGRGV